MNAQSLRTKPYSVSDVMTSPVVSVPVDTPVKLVAELMLTQGISAVPVVDASGRPVGMISEADLLLREVAAEPGLHLPWLEAGYSKETRRRQGALTAGDLMSTPVVTVHPETSLRLAAKLMFEKRFKRLPVVDGRSLIGIVSRADVLRVYLIADEHLRRRAARAVQAALGRDARDTHIDVLDGFVTIAGEVPSRSEVDLIRRIVSRLDGVLGMHMKLEWRIDDTLRGELKRLAHV